MSSTTDFPDWSPHVAAAQQISVTGVPLLTKPAVVVNQGTVTLTPNQVFSYGTQPLNQPGYALYCAVSFPAGTSAPFVQLQLNWLDSVLGVTVAADNFICTGGPTGTMFVTRGGGLVKGDQLIAKVRNLDLSQNATVNFYLVQDSVVRRRDEISWWNDFDGPILVPSHTLPSLPADESSLGMLSNFAVAASTTTLLLFGMWDGLVEFGYKMNTGAAASLTLSIRPQPDSYYTPQDTIFSAAAPTSPFQVTCPRAPLLVSLKNTATTGINVSLRATRVAA